MEEVDIFACKRERTCVATESVAPSSTSGASAQSEHDDNTYHYVAMREPGPQDAIPIAYGYYPQPPFAYAYPQHPVAVAATVAAPTPCEEETYNYVAEKVVQKREKSVRAPSPPQVCETPVAYAPVPAVFPTAFAMPNYPIPVHPVKEKPKDKDDGKRVWVGRTKKQVDEDNAKIASKEGVYKPNEIMPKNAAPDQLFWVIEPDNTNTLRTYRTIEEDLQPGKWKIDPRYGNAYFLRNRDKK